MREIRLLALSTCLVGFMGSGRLVAQEGGEFGSPNAVVAAFHRALAASDRQGVLALLDPEVVIFEAGGAEISREEYATQHLQADMEFAAGTRRELVEQWGRGSGNLTWLLTRSETTGTFRGREIRASGVETMILELRDGDWRIVHIHWSSHNQD